MSDAVWAAASAVILTGWFILAINWRETGWDFTMFYVAAHTPIESIHDQHVFQTTARHVLAGTGVTYASPYVRPVVFALGLQWMRGLPYWEAYRIWVLLQLAFYAGTLWALARYFHVRIAGYYPWVFFYPVFFGIITGQDSLITGLLLCLALVLLERRRDVAAGVLLSLTIYKFNLFFLLPVYLYARKRYRSLLSYGICGAALAITSAILESPATYLSLLPEIQRYTIGFSPERMLGLRGIFASLGLTPAYPIAALLLIVYTVVLSQRMQFRRGLGMIVAANVLCAYHVTWYDGAVLVLPLALALVDGCPTLRLLAAALMLLPFWDRVPPVITAVLLGFTLLYSAPSAWIRMLPGTFEKRPE